MVKSVLEQITRFFQSSQTEAVSMAKEAAWLPRDTCSSMKAAKYRGLTEHSSFFRHTTNSGDRTLVARSWHESRLYPDRAVDETHHFHPFSILPSPTSIASDSEAWWMIARKEGKGRSFPPHTHYDRERRGEGAVQQSRTIELVCAFSRELKRHSGIIC